MNDIKLLKAIQELVGKGRDGEYVLSKSECMEIMQLVYNQGIQDSCDAILETSSTGCHDHVERLMMNH